MNRTSLLLPAPLLGLAGCAPGGPLLDGPWSLSSLTQDGETVQYPRVESYEYYGYSETYTSSVFLTAWSGNLARLTQQYTEEEIEADGTTYTSEGAYSYAGHWIAEDGGFTLFFDEAGLDMSCTVDGDAMSCDLEFQEGSAEFTR